MAIPPPATESDIAVVGSDVTGPGGIVFGRLHKLGLFNAGKTSIDRFFAHDRKSFPEVSGSMKRVMRAVSQNEGKLEAINTWDNGILSCGIYQWTIGRDGDAGELPGLLDVLKQRSSAAYESCFGSLGLGFRIADTQEDGLRRGYLVLNGVVLDNAGLKEQMRSHIWAYRFWRAAHDPDVRRAQIALAMSRIGKFYRLRVSGKQGPRISDCITSEYGIALLLDQHVNRPAHVSSTLASAIGKFMAAGGKSDPEKWTGKDEARVLDFYLELRAKTSMTDSDKRAQRTRSSVKSGKLSDRRGSFRP